MIKILKKDNVAELISSLVIIIVVTGTILYGSVLSQGEANIRQWHWENMFIVLPVVPLLFMQRAATLPPAFDSFTKTRWVPPFVAGLLFGLADVLVIKLILHPQAYDSIPPFLQPFPYSLFLYTSGAIEVELYHRMLPLTLILLADRIFFKSKHRRIILIVLGILSSLAEPLLQLPDGAMWFIMYALVSGIAMNALQFCFYIERGFAASLTVRLGHYLIWHIMLGLYVQFAELR